MDTNLHRAAGRQALSDGYEAPQKGEMSVSTSGEIQHNDGGENKPRAGCVNRCRN